MQPARGEPGRNGYHRPLEFFDLIVAAAANFAPGPFRRRDPTSHPGAMLRHTATRSRAEEFAIATDLACADRLDLGSHLSAGGSKVRTLGPPSVKVRNADRSRRRARRAICGMPGAPFT